MPFMHDDGVFFSPDNPENLKHKWRRSGNDIWVLVGNELETEIVFKNSRQAEDVAIREHNIVVFLREKIEKAPHEEKCLRVMRAENYIPGTPFCTCWKASVVKEEK